MPLQSSAQCQRLHAEEQVIWLRAATDPAPGVPGHQHEGKGVAPARFQKALGAQPFHRAEEQSPERLDHIGLHQAQVRRIKIPAELTGAGIHVAAHLAQPGIEALQGFLLGASSHAAFQRDRGMGLTGALDLPALRGLVLDGGQVQIVRPAGVQPQNGDRVPPVVLQANPHAGHVVGFASGRDLRLKAQQQQPVAGGSLIRAGDRGSEIGPDFIRQGIGVPPFQHGVFSSRLFPCSRRCLSM